MLFYKNNAQAAPDFIWKVSSDEIIRSTYHLLILFVYVVCLLQMICKVHCPNLAFEFAGNSVIGASPVTPITKDVYKLQTIYSAMDEGSSVNNSTSMFNDCEAMMDIS